MTHPFILPETLDFFPRLLLHIRPRLCCQVGVIRMAGSSPPVCHPDTCHTDINLSRWLFIEFPSVSSECK